MGKSRLLEEIQHSSLGGKEEAVYRVRASASTAHRSQVRVITWPTPCRAFADPHTSASVSTEGSGHHVKSLPPL